MISVKGVSRRFDDRVVLRDVSFDIPDKKVVAILGPSGIGKTVLLRIMTGLLSPDRGTVEYDGIQVRYGAFADNFELLSRLGFVFQGGALFDSLSVYDNVAFPLRESRRMKEAELDRRVNEVLERVGMQDNARLLPGALSGGMTRLVAIARALACNPDYVFYDEPTTGLDPVMRSRIIELVLSLRDREAKTEVAVTHDLEAAEQMADIIYMLRDARISVLDSARKEHYEAQRA